jgi:hypothetical protein
MTRFTLLLSFLLLCIGLSAQTPCVGNITLNPGFENGLTDWTNLFSYSQTTNIQVNAGVNSLQMCKDSVSSRIYQTINITPQKSYILTAMVKKTGVAPTNLYLKFLDATFQAVHAKYTQVDSDSYLSKTVAATAPGGAIYLEYGFLKDEGVGCFFADEVCMTVSDILIATKEEELVNVFELFPVPTNEVVFLSFKNTAIVNKSSKGLLINQLGQVEREFSLVNIQNEVLRLDISDIPKGVYFVKIITNGAILKMKKLVIN